MQSNIEKLDARKRLELRLLLRRFYRAVRSRKANHNVRVAKVRDIELTDKAKELYR